MQKTIIAGLLTLVCSSVLALDENDAVVNQVAAQYQIPQAVMHDFVASYNFKCPAKISEAQLVWLLKEAPYDNELRVMAESEGMEYRDIYVDARSNIQCLSKGEVSRAY
ncbi:MAG: hypothetical protein H7A08_00960 [Oceanospirillaceae bacterium]|nr:hypothetical protein [Oceanospirillaceae bacterium]